MELINFVGKFISQVKRGIPRIRENLTEEIWLATAKNDVLRQQDWTADVIERLQVSRGQGERVVVLSVLTRCVAFSLHPAINTHT